MNIFKRKILNYRQRIDEHMQDTVTAALLHKNTFLPYKNLCKGKQDIVVCGAGPSLNKYKPLAGALHIAVNRAFLYDKVDFDFIFAQDFDGIRMVIPELIDYRPDHCVKFLAQTRTQNRKTIPESLALKCKAKRFICDYYIYGDGFKSKPVLDLENRALGGMPNVGMSVIQLALYMNPKKIYIVGCDMSGTHAMNGNQSKKELSAEEKQFDSYWKQEQTRLINKWIELKSFAETYYPETRTISINPVGLNGVFEDVFQE